MPPERDPLRDAYDPERFRAAAHALVDRLADYLASAQRRELPVLPWREPDAQAAAWSAAPPRTGDPAALLPLVDRVLAESTHLHHPGFVGHQVTAPLPAAVLGEWVSALLNNGMAVYEMGPAAVPLERAALRWLADCLGLGPDAGGVLTSGGSIGNLTALLAARQIKAGFDAWGAGASGGPPLCVLVGAEAHYCVKRAAQVMGLGEQGVVLVPADERFRTRPDALPAALDDARRRGRRPFALVASACSTATGAFDPIEPMAAFCAREGLWLHVDAAHGGAAALSPRHRTLVAGIERADSVVWDAHKMLLVPALVTAVLFRDGRHAYQAFAQRAAYLFDGAPEDEWWNVGQRTLECTKRMMALALHTTLVAHGTELLEAYVARMFELGARFGELITAAPDFELATPPDCNIVCFRHVPRGFAGDLDALQGRLRQRVIAGGAFYPVQTTLGGRVFLRVTLINPLTAEADLAALLEAVRAAV